VFITDHRRDRAEMMHRGGFDCLLQMPIDPVPVGCPLVLEDAHVADFGRGGIVDRICGQLRQYRAGIEFFRDRVRDIQRHLVSDLGALDLHDERQCVNAFFNAVGQQDNITLIETDLERVLAIAETGDQAAVGLTMVASHQVDKLVV